ncbi:hypothetical protein BDF21DRAFT_485538 [Thamnidium elegans]|nr:hypothetical protein BDF21DRAFT_485538 [Thamnidium elegans]
MYSPLADTQESIDDVKELSFTPLSEPLTVNIDDIDLDGERAYGEGIVSRGQLREFYGPGKRASAKRKVEILGYKFRSHLFTQERKEMKYGELVLVQQLKDIVGMVELGNKEVTANPIQHALQMRTKQPKLASITFILYIVPIKNLCFRTPSVYPVWLYYYSTKRFPNPQQYSVSSIVILEIKPTLFLQEISNQVKICLLRFQYLQISWWRKGKDLVTLAEPMTLPRF